MTAPAKARPLFDPPIVRRALFDAVTKLDPRRQVRNPVMCTVFVGSLLTTGLGVHALATAPPDALFTFGISAWLWFTVLFANFAEAMAEGRGKAQADTLRKTKTETMARRLRDGSEESIPATQLRRGDIVMVEAGEVIPGDGDVIEGSASVDESA